MTTRTNGIVFGWLLGMLALFPAGAGAADPDPAGRALSAAMIWTGATNATNASGYFVAFRKSFTLPVRPNKATLSLFADVRYLLWVNGQYVDRGPARFEPVAPEYDMPELTPFLQAGTNTLAVLVTAHINNGKMRLHDPGLTAQLVADTGQGLRVVTGTDATWKWSDQTRYRAATADWGNLYDTVDARVEDGDWTRPEYDDRLWAAARPIKADAWGPLTARRLPPLRETVVLPGWTNGPVWPLTLKAGEQAGFQFPRLVLAYTRLELDADAGSELQLTWSPGTKYTCRPGPQTYISTDTHAIFAGAIRVKSGRVTLKNVTFVERLYPFDRAGSFQCSDPLLNRLWTTCVRGLEITSEDAYVDCADRERVEWMDCDPPAFDVTRVAMAGPDAGGGRLLADPRLLGEMVRRTALTLQPEGWVKAHTCSDRFDIHAKMEDRACDWVEGARRYYESCGRTEVIREIWPAVVRQMDYFLDRRTPRGLLLAREWVVWGNPVGYQTCEGTALNAFFYRALADAAFLGRLIGEQKTAARYEQAARELAGNINARLWDEPAGAYFAGYLEVPPTNGVSQQRKFSLTVADHLIEPTRHAALFALDQGAVPAERRDRVRQYLLAHPPADNNIMQYYYYFKQQFAADDAGQDVDFLHTLRTQWEDMAESPYEATFEGLHSWGSQAHGYGMFPAYFLSAYVLGVRRDGAVQQKSLLIEPRLGDLTAAAGTVVTEFGVVPVSWTRAGAQWNFAVEVPAGPTTRLRLPVGPGRYSATLDGRPVESRTRLDGRWLEIKLPAGRHAGSWSSAG